MPRIQPRYHMELRKKEDLGVDASFLRLKQGDCGRWREGGPGREREGEDVRGQYQVLEGTGVRYRGSENGIKIYSNGG